MMEIITRKERLAKSIAELEAELVAETISLGTIADEFIDTTDAATFEERFAQASPALQEVVKERAYVNFLNFDTVIADIASRGGYTAGWIALRDWARRQPWAEEAERYMAPIMARRGSDDDAEEAGRRYAEQGRMLGILRVDLMRATSDEERVAITKQIEALEAEFTKTNFG